MMCAGGMTREILMIGGVVAAIAAVGACRAAYLKGGKGNKDMKRVISSDSITILDDNNKTMLRITEKLTDNVMYFKVFGRA